MTDCLWTAEFFNGSRLTQLNNPRIPFAHVYARLTELYKFSLHFPDGHTAAVRLNDGYFYHGPNADQDDGWFIGPKHQRLDSYRLYFSRSCQMMSGTMKTTIANYSLGWSSPNLIQAMLLLPDGSFTWKVANTAHFRGDV